MSDGRIHVLLVEDSDLDARLVADRVAMAEGGDAIEFSRARTRTEALNTLDAQQFDCILLDLNLPDGRGVENVERVAAAANQATIVVMTGLSDESTAIAALKLGAQEYVAKDNYDGPSLLRVLRHAIERNKLLSEINAKRDEDYLAASHDTLTGLANRKLFEDRGRQALAAAARNGRPLAFCFIDLDGFKPVNDQLGHASGDALLKRIAQLMENAVRGSDTIARVGGDEFAALLSEFKRGEDAREAALHVAQRICSQIGNIDTVDGRAVSIGASVGVAMYPDHGLQFDKLMINADMAMYAAKRSAGESVMFYSASLRGLPGSTQPLSADIQKALDQGDFVPACQAIWSVETGVINGVEVLMRWNHDGQMWLPAQFYVEAERSGQIVEIGKQTRQAALRQFQRWRVRGLDITHMALNMSTTELSDQDSVGELLELVNDFGFPAGSVQVEVDVSTLSGKTSTLEQLRSHGVSVIASLDAGADVSLSALATGPLDGVKLSRNLLEQLMLADEDPQRRVVDAIVALVTSLGLPISAVGVENDRELDVLRGLPCGDAQGFMVGPALAADEVAQLFGKPVSDFATPG